MRPTLSHNYRLERLQKWLNHEVSGAVLFAVSFYFYSIFYLIALTAAAFCVYLLFVLYRGKRFGWMTALFIMVIIPAAVIFFVDAGTWNLVLPYFPITSFFIYCMLLKMTIPEWIDS